MRVCYPREGQWVAESHEEEGNQWWRQEEEPDGWQQEPVLE